MAVLGRGTTENPTKSGDDRLLRQGARLQGLFGWQELRLSSFPGRRSENAAAAGRLTWNREKQQRRGGETVAGSTEPSSPPERAALEAVLAVKPSARRRRRQVAGGGTGRSWVGGTEERGGRN